MPSRKEHPVTILQLAILVLLFNKRAETAAQLSKFVQDQEWGFSKSAVDITLVRLKKKGLVHSYVPSVKGAGQRYMITGLGTQEAMRALKIINIITETVKKPFLN